MIFYLKIWCIILTYLSLSACAFSKGQGVNTLDALTISVQNDGILSNPINLHYPLQTRFLSVNGQLPVPAPGSSCLASSFRPANSIICFSESGSTQFQVRHFPYEGDRNNLFELQRDLSEIQLDIAELIAEDVFLSSQNKNTATTPQTIVSKAQAVTESAKNLASEIVNENVFIFRWRSENQANSEGEFGTILSALGAEKSSERGLVIIGGLTVSQLLLGLTDYSSVLGKYPRGAKIATLTMGAENLIYFTGTDLSAALSGKFEGNVENLSQNLSPETQIALSAYAAIGRAQENQGNFSAPEVKNYFSLAAYHSDSPSQQIFYSTMTDIESLVNLLSKPL
ncbi:hypothetical protein HVA01_07640 [Halovibrio variabilis]|uniref:Lipoprotein n=2 Tax=Halovibrio variabilis TaxID=31910 RepID=A0A511UN86_9GAMM|nr:hypothetical protein HVA01_07640 [Halovibrio variabilis]